MVCVVKAGEVEAQKFLPSSGFLPFHDGTADMQTTVWAVYRSPNFRRDWRVGPVQYHATLGWRPQGTNSWDWEVSEWQYLPQMPNWAREENRAAGYRDES